jgi:geranylgeranyl diphosphate synthase type I
MTTAGNGATEAATVSASYSASGAGAAASSSQASVAFAELAAQVRAGVDAKLRQLLDARVVALSRHGEDVARVVDALRGLSVRGGKRLRAVLVAAGYDACGGERGPDAVVMAGVAFELLQTYLLIHDDWMDDDEVRRGGPSVHALLREQFKSKRDGDAAAILAGDHASALAQEALLSIPLGAERVLETAREFARIQEDVVTGQLLDLRQAGGGAVEAMHDLKTGSYTVRGPLILGAILAGATGAQREALRRFAGPLGVAFQLRDDLLGTFGDPRETGKPAGNDVRRGKRTALIAELEGDAEASALFPRAFGVDTATDADVDALVARMISSGAKGRVEARLHELLAVARRELAGAPLTSRGKAVLEGAGVALGDRER